MPSRKPKIQVVMDPEKFKKFEEICKKEDRSMSKMAARIIEQYISRLEDTPPGIDFYKKFSAAYAA